MLARILVLSMLILPFLISPYPTAAASEEPTPAPALLLEIWINGHTQHVVAEVMEQPDGVLLVDAMTLEAAGLKFSLDDIRADGFIEANRFADVKMAVNHTEQKLEVTAPTSRIRPQVFELMPQPTSVSSGTATGFMTQYDLVGTVDNFDDMGRSSATGVALNSTLFSPRGNLNMSGFAEQQYELSRFIRLDTTYEFNQPDSLQRWQVGDAISGSQTWARSVRFAGIQLATDFSLRPDLSTLPLPAFFGETAVPASVDIFVNSARVFQTDVEPGPFEINNLPVISGSGEASVVVRDVLGRESVVTMPFYAHHSLLRKGLESYNFDLGFLRRNYGQESFSYADAIGTATYSRGLTDWLTLQTHGEAAESVQNAGVGTAISLAPYGMVEVAAAVSRHNYGGLEPYGTLHSIAFKSDMQPFGMFGSLSVTTGEYEDIASIGSSAPSSLQTQIGGYMNFDQYGSLALSHISIKQENGSSSRFATGTYTVPISDRWNLGISSFYDYTTNNMVTQGFLSVMMDNGWIGQSNARKSKFGNAAEVGMIKPANPDGGFGYRATAGIGDGDLREGETTYMGPRGNISGAVATRDGQQAGRVNASGGLVWMDGDLYATQRPDGSVALVNTGKGNTPVYRENRLVTTTDDNGRALVTGLLPYTANRLSIDPHQYDFSTLVDSTDQVVIPGRQSGVRVDFSPKSAHPALVVLQLEDGTPPPLGAIITLNTALQEQLVVGRRGEVFFTDLTAPVDAQLSSEKVMCQFSVSPPEMAPTDHIPRIEPVICVQPEATAQAAP